MALRGRRSRNKNPKPKLEVRNTNNGYSNNRYSKNRNSNGRKIKVNDPKKMILMAIIIIAFICGLILGLSFILGGFDSSDGPGEVKYENVTNNITKYENGSDLLETENGTYISYSEFDDNATEGQNITAFNASGSTNLY